MKKPRVGIRANGDVDGTRIYLAGQDISGAVRGVSWRHDVHGVPMASVDLRVVELDVEGGEVEWYGLEQVPTAALLAELRRRGDDPS